MQKTITFSTYAANKCKRNRAVKAIMAMFNFDCRQAINFLRNCAVDKQENLFMSKIECDNYDYESQFLSA